MDSADVGGDLHGKPTGWLEVKKSDAQNRTTCSQCFRSCDDTQLGEGGELRRDESSEEYKYKIETSEGRVLCCGVVGREVHHGSLLILALANQTDLFLYDYLTLLMVRSTDGEDAAVELSDGRRDDSRRIDSRRIDSRRVRVDGPFGALGTRQTQTVNIFLCPRH